HVLADAGQVMAHGNAVLAEKRCRTDAGQLEDLRRSDRSGRENDFGPRVDTRELIAVPEIDARCPLAAEPDLLNMRISRHAQVPPADDRLAEGLRSRVAAPVADRALEIADAFIVSAVVIVGRGNPVVEHRLPPGLDDLPADAVLLDVQLAV